MPQDQSISILNRPSNSSFSRSSEPFYPVVSQGESSPYTNNYEVDVGLPDGIIAKGLHIEYDESVLEKNSDGTSYYFNADVASDPLYAIYGTVDQIPTQYTVVDSSGDEAATNDFYTYTTASSDDQSAIPPTQPQPDPSPEPSDPEPSEPTQVPEPVLAEEQQLTSEFNPLSPTPVVDLVGSAEDGTGKLKQSARELAPFIQKESAIIIMGIVGAELIPAGAAIIGSVVATAVICEAAKYYIDHDGSFDGLGDHLADSARGLAHAFKASHNDGS